MLKYVKRNDDNQVTIFVGTDINWAISQGFKQCEVEKGYDGNWYLSGLSPNAPQPTYVEKRLTEYPPLADQLDMIYHNFEDWKSTISKIKEKYPKVDS